MNKWYYTWHAHTGTVSFFETSEYEGRGGYETKESAVNAARSALIRQQRETSLSLMVRSNEVARMATELEEIGRELLKLEKV